MKNRGTFNFMMITLVSSMFFLFSPIKSMGTVILQLKNGNPLTGKLILVEEGKVTFETGGIQLTLPIDRIIPPETAWLKGAAEEIANGDYLKAAEFCKQTLIWDPNNVKAKELLNQVNLKFDEQKKKQEEEKLALAKEEAQKKAEQVKIAAEKAAAEAAAKIKEEEARKKPLEILKKVSETFKNLKSLRVEGVLNMETKARGMNESVEVPFVITEAKPDKLRVEIKNPMMEMQIISDGKSTWMYFPQKKQYTKIPGSFNNIAEKMGSNANFMSSSISEYENIANDIKTVKLLREEFIAFSGSSANCYVIQLEKQSTEKNDMFEVSPKIYWIDKNSNIPIKEAVTMIMKSQPMAIKQTSIITSMKLNESLPNNMFVFTPPPDVTEITGSGGNQQEYVNLSGKQEIDFTLNDLDRKTYNLKSFKGKVVLIDFWATWCPPCREELPTIQKLHQQFKDKGLVVLGVNDEKPEVARAFVQKNNFTFPVLIDDQNAVSKQYQVEAIPTVLIINKEGVITTHFVGGKAEAQLRAALKKAGIE